MKKIEAKIIADSINPQGDRITTYILTFPRFILAELNTHRVFSKNSASSRAIPFEKMVKMVEEDPFIPIAWQKDHKGMQGTEYLNEEEVEKAKLQWIQASRNAINSARMLNSNYFGVKKNLVTKQLCNRLLEPFMWHTVLLTGTEFENFFELRCPIYRAFGNVFKSRKDCIEKYPANINLTDLDWLEATESQAEIHMQALAEAMWDAYNESTPKELKAGEWHIPFGDKMQDRDIMQCIKGKFNSRTEVEEAIQKFKIKIAVARCARLSYMTFDGEIDYEKDIKLHDILLESHHMSPFEHCSRVMSDEEYTSFIKGKSNANWNTDLVTDDTYEISAQFDNTVLGWCNNFRGFIQYRYLIENEYE